MAMRTGLLWYDADPKKTLEDKIAEAAQRYFQKFGVRPNACYVHPSALVDKTAVKNGIKITSALDILPNHLWLGVAG
jgi:hypothetical protein